MAGLLDLFGGGGSDPADIYGDLFTDKQRAALRDQQMTGLLGKLAGAFAAGGMPSRMPIPLGSTIGAAAAAGLGGEDEVMNRMLKGMQTAEAVRESQQKRGFQAQFMTLLKDLYAKEQTMGLPPGTLTKPAIASMGAGATGAPTGGPPASNAPPPPAVGETFPATTGGPGTTPGGGDFPGATALPQQQGLLGAPPQNPVAAQFAGGLLGGGPRSPFGGAEADRPIDIELLSGEAVPVLADEALRKTVPAPSLAGPPRPASAWAQGYSYDAPPLTPNDVLPSGARLVRDDIDPSKIPPPGRANPRATPEQSAAPPSELDRLSQLMKVETLARPAAASNLTGSAWEIANNNFGGMRRPGVNASPSQGGFQTFATPEEGLAGISRQLDRYASGATTGKPLSTIREIVSTWAPPSENDTEALIKRATRVMGVADNIPLNLSDPAVKAKLIEATIRNEQGGRLPVDPALIGRVANAPPGTYAASSGGGGRSNIDIEPLGGEAAPAGAAPASGKIPGLNTTPQGLAILNSMAKISGLGDPFGSLLETYYKSPGYLGDVKRQSESIETEFAGKKAEAAAAATQKYIQENATHQSNLEMVRNLVGKGVYLDTDGKMKTITNADQALAAIDIAKEKAKADAQLVDTTLTFPGEAQPRTLQMRGDQARAITEGRPVPELGIPAMTGIQLGKLVPSEQDKSDIQVRGAAQTEMYKAGQKALDTAHDAVRGANQRAPYYGSMLTAMRGFQPGATAEARLTAMQYLKDFGIIKGDNVSQGEALRLAGERLAFLAVPPNQGSWSNVERQLLKSSIGGLSMTPEGLTEAIRMMQQLDDYDRKVSEIHRQVADKNKGLPNLLEAQRRVEALGPPLSAQQEAALERLRQPAPTAGSASTSLPGGATAPLPPPVGTIQDGYRFKGGAAGDPNSWERVP